MEPYLHLEQEWTKFSGSLNTVACSSGSAALHLALEALQLPKGSKVLVPEFTMIACARAVTMAGLVPKFIDCTDDLLMDVGEAARVLRDSRAVSAIMPVHIYGRESSMSSVAALSIYHDLKIIEDRAECPIVSHPYTPDAACWSFYSNKIIAGEEGGMIAFKQAGEGTYARSLRSQGFTAQHDFLHLPRGCNYRLSNANAREVLEGLYNYNAYSELESRREVEGWYNRLIPQELQMPPRQMPWVYDLKLPEGQSLDRVVYLLGSKHIQARHSFKPMSMQAEYRAKYQHLNAYRLSQRVMYLPISPEMTEQDVEQIVKTLLEAL